jgi:hypothetical protein
VRLSEPNQSRRILGEPTDGAPACGNLKLLTICPPLLWRYLDRSSIPECNLNGAIFADFRVGDAGGHGHIAAKYCRNLHRMVPGITLGTVLEVIRCR